MVRVFVVGLVGSAAGELHREPEAVRVLRARLAQDLERFDTRDRGKARRRCEEVLLFVGPLGVREREDDGMPDPGGFERHA